MMVHIAQHPGVKGLGHLVLRLQALDALVIEFRRAGEIVLQGRRGERTAPEGRDILRCLRDAAGDAGRMQGGHGHPPPERNLLEMVFQLLDIAAFLARLDPFRAAVIDHPHLFGTLEQAVEIVGPHGILELIGREPEALAEFRRDEGGADAAAREHPLIGRKDDDVPEIERTRFQRPHDLEALQRLSLERDGNPLREQPGYQPPGAG